MRSVETRPAISISLFDKPRMKLVSAQGTVMPLTGPPLPINLAIRNLLLSLAYCITGNKSCKELEASKHITSQVRHYISPVSEQRCVRYGIDEAENSTSYRQTIGYQFQRKMCTIAVDLITKQ